VAARSASAACWASSTSFSALLEAWAAAELLLPFTRHHGNIEDLSVPGHALNPVPFAAVGPSADALKARVHRITDIAPVLLDVWPDKAGRSSAGASRPWARGTSAGKRPFRT